MRWPLVCQNDLWRKLKPEFAKIIFDQHPDILGGGFKYLLCSPVVITWGNVPIWLYNLFTDGLVQPPTRYIWAEVTPNGSLEGNTTQNGLIIQVKELYLQEFQVAVYSTNQEVYMAYPYHEQA